MHQDTTLRIRTIDGEEHLFAMPAATDQNAGYTIGSRIEKLLHQRNVALEVDGRLIIIPMAQIRSIEVSPVHHKLPEAVVPSVMAISSSLTARNESKLPTPRRKSVRAV